MKKLTLFDIFSFLMGHFCTGLIGFIIGINTNCIYTW